MSTETINTTSDLTDVDNTGIKELPNQQEYPLEVDGQVGDKGFDKVAAYFAWEDECKRLDAAKHFGLEPTASWEEIYYHENLALERAAWELELERKRKLLAKIAAGHVVPNQETLPTNLSEKITRLYRDNIYPTRTRHPDLLF